MRLVIVEIDRCVEPVRFKSDTLCKKFPGPGDDFLFKIISKTEVPQHLKKCVMSCSTADIFNVIGPDALLCCSRSFYLGGLQSQEVLFERDHACYCEKQRRIIGHQ